MEHEDLKSDLQSLRKLYGHLQSLKIGSQSASSEYLDEKAQLLFKDLLDGASERIFGAHSEFMVARLHVSEETPTTQLENQKDIPMSKPPGSPPHVSETSPGVSQNINCNSVTADGNQQNVVKLEALAFASENSNCDYCYPKPVKRRRYCRIPCKIHIEKSKSRETKKDNSDKELKQLNESSPYHWSETQQQKIVLDDTANVNDTSNFNGSVSISGNEDVAKSEAGSDIGRKIEKKTEDTKSILKQIASTINIIDSHILALKLAVDPVITEQLAVNHTESTQAQKVLSVLYDMESKPSVRSVSDYKDTNLVSHNPVNPSISGNEVLSHMLDHNPMKSTEIGSPDNNTNLREIIGKTMSTSLKNNWNEDQERNPELKESFIENQVSGRNVKAMVHKIELMSQLESESEWTTSHGCKYVRGMRVSESLSNVATATPFPGRTGKEFQNPLLRHQNELDFGTSRSSMPNRIYHQFMASPILYGKEIGQGEGRARENKKSVADWKKISPHQLDLEEARSSSVASTSWTSQQASTSGGNSEEYSFSDTQSNDYMGPSSNTNSESDSFLSQTRGYKNNTSSSGDRDVDLSESTDQQNVDRDVDSQSISVGSVTNRRSSNSIKVKNQTGRFRKLKDKLGLIFHHHHHHHHHHDYDDNVYDHRIKATHGRSLWKSAVKFFRSTGRTEKHREKAAEKVARSLVQKVPKKNQNGNFHALVKEALRHVRNSKSPKLPKGDIKRIQKGHRGGKNGAQKLHWWRMLQQQRAIKVPSKPNVNLGLGTKEPRFRALPKLMSDNGEG